MFIGCAGPGKVHTADPSTAFVFGSLNLDDKYVATAVIMHEYGVVYAPLFKTPPQTHTYTNGSFFF